MYFKTISAGFIVGCQILVLCRAFVSGIRADRCGPYSGSRTGREFIFSIPVTTGSTMVSVLAGHATANVELWSPGLPETHTTHRVHEYESLPVPVIGALQKDVGTSSNVFHLTSDVDIVVSVFTPRCVPVRLSYYVLPVNVLATQYRIDRPFGGGLPDRSVLLITSVFNDSLVTIQFPHSLKNSTVLKLNKYETFQYLTNGSLKGSVITSNKPIQALYATEGVNKACKNRTMAWSQLILTQNTAHVEKLSPKEPPFVVSESPVTVAQNGATVALFGESLAIFDPNTHRFLDHHAFFVSTSTGTNTTRYLSIVVPTATANNLLLDGKVISGIQRSSDQGTFGNYTVIVTSVDEGMHNVSVSGGAPAGLPSGEVYGIRRYGYTFPHPGGGHPLYPDCRTSRCFSCDNMTNQRSCDNVQQCGEDQACLVERYRLPSGEVRFKSGCAAKIECADNDRVPPADCRQCCLGDDCNQEGCGEVAPYRNERGPYCYDCPLVDSISQCHHVTQCARNQMCRIEQYKSGTNAWKYSMGCHDAPVGSPGDWGADFCFRLIHTYWVAGHPEAPICWPCCDRDFCNDQCIKSATIMPFIG